MYGRIAVKQNIDLEKKTILFLDFDGTLVETESGKTFPQNLWDMRFKKDVWNKIKDWYCLGNRVFVVTNQGGIEKGHVLSYQIESKIKYVCCCLEEWIESEHRVAYEMCGTNDPTHPCRKPNTKMLQVLLDHHCNKSVAKNRMFMVGDASGLPGQFSDSDRKTAANFGIDYLDVSEFLKIEL